MIHLRFEQAAAYYVILLLAIIVCGWVLTRDSKAKSVYIDKAKFWQCSICAFVYMNIFDDEMTVCPQCGSYNKKEVEE